MNTKRQIKSFAFHFLWMLLRHHSDGSKPICLFSSRRGGSTWLQEVLCSNKRIRYIDQPFSFYSGPPFLHEYLPIYYNSVPLFFEEEKDEIKIKNYLTNLFEGNLVHSSQWRFWKRDFWVETNRVLLKITKGKPLINWINSNFDVNTLYLIRHPISQAASVVKAGWENDSLVYLKNERFKKEYLNDGLVKSCFNVLNKGNKIEKFVLNWCLENYIPFKFLLEHHEWTLVSYEECVVSPNEMVTYLAGQLGLNHVYSMKKQIKMPSRTSKFTNSNNKTINKKERLSKWQENISKDEINRCFDLIEQFGIDFYSRTNLLPTEKYLHFAKVELK